MIIDNFVSTTILSHCHFTTLMPTSALLASGHQAILLSGHAPSSHIVLGEHSVAAQWPLAWPMLGEHSMGLVVYNKQYCVVK